ncbi:MAG: response regulator [Bacteroidales bacterium]|nr:response regulator [Bacteroidales bacterium]
MVKNFLTIITRLALLLFLTVSAHARSYTFQHITTANGLTSNAVMFCLQDDFGFIWVASKDGIFRYDGHEFEPLSQIDPEGYTGGKIFSMAKTQDGIIWFSADQYVGYFNTRTNESGSVDSIPNDIYYTICPDNDGNIWLSGLNSTVKYSSRDNSVRIFSISMRQSSQAVSIGPDNGVYMTSDDGYLLLYDPLTNEFEERRFLSEADMATGVHASNLAYLGDGIMLICDSRSRLIKYDCVTEGSEMFSTALQDAGINYILVRTASEIWVGTGKGLYVLDANGNISDFISDHTEYELSNANIISILQDRENNLWVCTYHGGLNLLIDESKGIRFFPELSTREQINGRLVRAITSDNHGRIWIGTEDGGLCTYSPATDIITDLGARNNLPEYNYQAFANLDDEIWAATFWNGIMVFDSATGRLKRNIRLPGLSCSYIFKARDGSVYLGTASGAYVFNRETGSFVLQEETSGCFIHSIIQDSYGTIWLGCFGQGIWMKRNSASSFTKVLGADTDIPLSSEFISSMYEDDSHRLWVATEGAGAFYFVIGDERPEPVYFGSQNGFPSNIANAIAQDKNSRIWITTSMGLVEMNQDCSAVKRIYLDHSTSFSRSFCHNASCIAPDGIIYLGTYTGMVVLNPNDLSNSAENPPVYIKDVHIRRGNRTISIREDGKSSVLSKVIKINYSEASALSVNFCSPVFSSLSSPLYDYSLTGEGTTLTNTVANGNTVLTNLKPGRYVFTVWLAGNTAPEYSQSLTINVVPPFYRSLAAKLLYLLLGILAVSGIVYLRMTRWKAKQKLMQAEMENSKQKEIFDSRLSFFTYITHELRTPLTLIKLPIDKILAENQFPQEVQEDLMTVKANTDRLIELSNQFLELKKLSGHEMQLNFSNADICKIVRKVCGYFPAAIKERNLQFTEDIPDGPIWVSTVPDAIEKVVSNLLSNAVKYCSGKIFISLRSVADKIEIRVNSDGAHLSAANAEQIFDPFYRVNTGYAGLEGKGGIGLGLPLSRNLAVALGGSLVVDKGVKDMNSFLFTFPARPAVPAAEAGEVAPLAESNAEEEAREDRIILIAEDAKDLREYMSRELGRSYTTLTAANGREALGIIRSQKVDMVIADIMMPEMDGRELCKTIKNDVDLCFIPVILLTAVTGPESRIASLEAGADHFIEKPFSIELMKATIESLFHSREIMYKQFSESPLTHFNSISSNKMDQQFMYDLREKIFEHMADENLDVEMLTRLMGTSTSTLYRKVKANTGQKVNEYIKICRLKKAAELLAEGKYRINEVAYLTGFSSASYFATSFLKQFNISPSNFVKSIKNDSQTEQ